MKEIQGRRKLLLKRHRAEQSWKSRKQREKWDRDNDLFIMRLTKEVVCVDADKIRK